MAEEPVLDDDLDDEIQVEDLEEEDLQSEELEAEDDLPEEDLVEEPEPERRQPTRGEKRFQTLSHRTAKAEREAQELRERVARMEGSFQARPQSGPTEAERRAEAERIASMSPEERIDHEVSKVRRDAEAAFVNQGFRTSNELDEIKFQNLCRDSKSYRSVSVEVEKRLSDMHRNGQTAPRKTLANVILGERVAAKEGRGGRTVREDQDVRRQKSRPSRSGSDVPREREDRGRGRGKTAAERLAGKTF